MPCYRCGTRQTDPARGASPWKRGVRAGEQILVCPDCQSTADWTAEMDRCGRCGSSMLARALGETRCRACGHADAGPPGARPVGHPGGASADRLADEVARALDRVLGRDDGVGDAG